MQNHHYYYLLPIITHAINSRCETQNFLSRSSTRKSVRKMMHKSTISPLPDPPSSGANMHPICFDRIRDFSACYTGCTRRIRRTASTGRSVELAPGQPVTQRVNSTTQTELHARLVGMGRPRMGPSRRPA